MTDTLKQFHYGCKRADNGELQPYLRKVTGFSREQVTNCFQQYTDSNSIKYRRLAPSVQFVRRYTTEDTLILKGQRVWNN